MPPEEERPPKLSRRGLLRLAGTSLVINALGCSAPKPPEESVKADAPGRSSHDSPNPTAPLRDLKDKVAFITGGSSGIGLGLAKACKEEGMKVVISYLTEAHAQEAREHFADAPGRFLALKMDVTDRAEMERVADQIEAAFGNIHLFVNNAGVAIRDRVGEASYKDWDFALGVNLGGVVNGVHTFVPRIVAHGEPAQVVATASISGHFAGGYPDRLGGVVVTTKFAVVGLMESLRVELFDSKVGVSIVCPGAVQSRLGQSNRNRPQRLQNGQPQAPPETVKAILKKMESEGMDPVVCGRLILRGVKRNDLYIFTHPEYAPAVGERLDAIRLSFPLPRVDRDVRRSPIYGPEVARLKNDRGVSDSG